MSLEGFQSLLGFGLAAGLLFAYLAHGGAVSGALLLTYWALCLPVLGQELTLLTRQYPGHRNVTLRLLEPLGAREDVMGSATHEAPQGQASDTPPACQGVAITLDGVSVRGAGHGRGAPFSVNDLAPSAWAGAGSCACQPGPRSGSSCGRHTSHAACWGSWEPMRRNTCAGCSPGGWWARGPCKGASTRPGWWPGVLLLTLMPLRLWSTWMQGRFAIGVGGLLKPRLLAGALRLAPEEMRQWGAGQLLGRVFESEAVEALALSGGVFALLAVIELLLAALVLGIGAGGGLQVGLLLGWLGLAGGLGWCYRRSGLLLEI